ncbi:MAG: class I SAM-dependent methyltransferase [Terrimicrobiaceae bacterium]
MRFSHKIGKLLNRDACDSARATLRRLSYPLDARPFIEAIDRKAFDAIKARYFDPKDGVSPKKYFNLEDWMRTNVKRVRDLRLRKAPPRLRILDIGCGCGYFLHIAKCLGHDVLGLDIDREPIFREMVSLLGLERIVHRIEPFQALPDTGAPFDLITSHMTRFNWLDNDAPWGIKEWEFFLNDTASRLTPNGRLQFDLNALPDERHMERELRQYFRSKGARIDRRRIYLKPPPARAMAGRINDAKNSEWLASS